MHFRGCNIAESTALKASQSSASLASVMTRRVTSYVYNCSKQVTKSLTFFPVEKLLAIRPAHTLAVHTISTRKHGGLNLEEIS